MKNSTLLPLIWLTMFVLLYGREMHDNPAATPHEAISNTYCRTCHVCDSPTLDNPCLLDCPRHEGKFNARHLVADGPDIVILDQLTNLYSGVIFLHRLHAGMSEMNGSCESCHHYSEADAPVPPCRECHSSSETETSMTMPSLKAAYHRQCLNCHREWSHETDCTTCHEVIEEGQPQIQYTDKSDIMGIIHPSISAEEKYVYTTEYAEAPIVTFHHTDHVSLFGQQCVDCHRGNSCIRCHDSNADPSASDTSCKTCQDNCYTCHIDACRDEGNCTFCHDNQVKPPFSHDVSVGWPLGKYHSDNSCTNCHGPVKSFVVPSPECSQCHIHWEAGSFDHTITGLELSDSHVETECIDCHEEERYREPPSCVNCHDEDEVMYPDDLPGERIGE